MRHAAIVAEAPSRSRGLPFGAALAAIVVAAWAVMLAVWRGSIAEGLYPDPDDALRMLEVRDWLGGQAFRDVSQYRLDPPHGVAMHWSRLVDLPIAAVEVTLRPLLGVAGAEMAAALVVPMVTLACAIVLVGVVARRLAGQGTGLLSAAWVGLSIGAVLQLRPLRVDHHGWQIVLCLAAVAALLAPATRRSGIVAGLAIAVAIQISIESLPFAALVGAVVALGWAISGTAADRERLAGFAIALAAIELLLSAVLRGDWSGHCDAVSGPHLLALGVTAFGIAALTARAPESRAMRLLGIGAIGIAALAAFRSMPPHCGADAFSALQPIVRHYWYERTAEGMPVWTQTGIVAVQTIGFPLVGLLAAGFAVRRTSGEARARWLTLAILLLGATLTAVLVQRAGALANLLALPPACWAALRLVALVQANGSAIVRVLGSVAVLGALSPWTPIAIASAATREASDAAIVERRKASCYLPAAIRPLAALPSGEMLAPIDIGPAIILLTPMSVLASGHHRGQAGIGDELRAFMGSDETARRTIAAHRLRYVAVCDYLPEMTLYRRVAPDGFAAHLIAGRIPGWLHPVAVPGTPIRAWQTVNVAP